MYFRIIFSQLCGEVVLQKKNNLCLNGTTIIWHRPMGCQIQTGQKNLDVYHTFQNFQAKKNKKYTHKMCTFSTLGINPMSLG